MKETDFNVIKDEIQSQIEETSYEITDLLGSESVILCVMGIYLSNDLTDGYGQDFSSRFNEDESVYVGKVSVISTVNKISIITDEGMSYYRSDMDLCGYEELETDIQNILVIIQAVLDRIHANNP